MKERPILFSGPMVRAVLDGRKTQDRLIMKMKSKFDDIQTAAAIHQDGSGKVWIAWWGASAPTAEVTARMYPGNEGFACPHGTVGDRLWVRESWKTVLHSPGYDNGISEGGVEDFDEGVATINYRAGGFKTYSELSEEEDGQARRGMIKWNHSIHMPRWASRIDLEITGVRVERLQGISEEDAIAEGLNCLTKDGSRYKYGIADRDGLPGNDDYGWPWKEWENDPRLAYKKLWRSINGPGSWDANPWVWVIEFKRVQS